MVVLEQRYVRVLSPPGAIRARIKTANARRVACASPTSPELHCETKESYCRGTKRRKSIVPQPHVSASDTGHDQEADSGMAGGTATSSMAGPKATEPAHGRCGIHSIRYASGEALENLREEVTQKWRSGIKETISNQMEHRVTPEGDEQEPADRWIPYAEDLARMVHVPEGVRMPERT